jgi:Xaa-Pro aminopeptidase
MLEPLPPAFHRHVQQRLRARLDAEGFDGLLALATGNVIHLSGFFHSANERPVGLYLPVAGEPVLFVPLLEKENAEDGWIADVRTYPEYPGETHPVLWMLDAIGPVRLAVDALPWRLADAARDRVRHLAPTEMVSEARAAKQPEELAFIRAAAGYADLCLQAIRDDVAAIVRGGGTELDILAHGVGTAQRALLRDHGARLGHTRLGITASVHSGPRGALPHGRTIARVPQAGETLIAGIGAAVGGYHAESGITLVLGAPSADQRRCLEAAIAADAAARAALRPGMACEDVNEAALACIRDVGLGSFIRHRIGHGMGLEGHEGPWLASGDRTPVAPGMVFSSEPGIYRPGIDGYRTINTFIVTETGVEVPSTFQERHGLDSRVVPL